MLFIWIIINTGLFEHVLSYNTGGGGLICTVGHISRLEGLDNTMKLVGLQLSSFFF